MTATTTSRPRKVGIAALVMTALALAMALAGVTPAAAAPFGTFTQSGINYEVLTPAGSGVGELRVVSSNYSEVNPNLDLSGQITHTWPAGAVGESGTVIATAEARRYVITEIADWAFYSRDLTSVTLPPTLARLGTYAFYDNRLTRVELPSGLTTVPLAAFGQNQIQQIVWPGGLVSIGESAFTNNALTEITVPPSATSIGRSAFANNPATYIRIPASVTGIGQWAFSATPFPCVSTSAVIVFVGNAPAVTPAVGTRDPGDPCRSGESFFSGDGSTAASTVYFESGVTGFEPLAGGAWQGYAAQVRGLETVTFTTNGGTTAPSVTVMTADRLSSFPTVTRPGYSFTGWFADSALTDQFSLVRPVLADMTLYAGWTRNTVHVTFNVNGGDPLAAVDAPEGDPLSVVPTPVREWHTFTGWFTDSALTTAFDPAQPMLVQQTLHAAWERQLATVTFEVNGGAAIGAETVQVGTALASVPTPVREGYTFTGWFADVSLGSPADLTLAVTQSRTVYAGWRQDAVPPTPALASSPTPDLASTGVAVDVVVGSAAAAVVLLVGIALIVRSRRARG